MVGGHDKVGEKVFVGLSVGDLDKVEKTLEISDSVGISDGSSVGETDGDADADALGRSEVIGAGVGQASPNLIVSEDSNSPPSFTQTSS